MSDLTNDERESLLASFNAGMGRRDAPSDEQMSEIVERSFRKPLMDFLLARIAHDERVYGGCQHGLRPELAAHLLAECQAKRTLLTFATAVNTDMEHLVSARWTVTVLDTVARILARPYAYHADYRSEWA